MGSHAVENGQINHLSVSQITKFDSDQFGGCNRRWFYNKVMHLPEPFEKAHSDGVEMHGQIEHFLKTGEETLGDLARAGRHFIPEPGEGLLIEHRLEPGILTADGIPVVGAIDCLNTRGEYIDTLGQLRQEEGSTAEIIDWKSTADLKYGKTGPELLQTVQMVGYGVYTARKFPNLDHIRLSHVYFQKRGRKVASKSTVKISVATILNSWQPIEAVAREMRQVARETDPLKVPANYASCSAYRGCPFREICPKSNAAVITSLFGEGKGMSLLGKLRNKNAPKPEPEAPKNPEKLIEGLADLKDGLEAAIRAELKDLQEAENTIRMPPQRGFVSVEAEKAHLRSQVYGACTVCSEAVTAENGSRLRSGGAKHVDCVVPAIVPPDAPKSEGLNAAAPIPAGSDAPTAVKEAAAAMGLLEKPGEAQEAPKKRGRPPKATPTVTPEEAAKVEAAFGPKEETSPVTSFGFNYQLVIFVDTLVEGLRGESLEPYLSEVVSKICAAANVADLRYAPEGSPLSFGKWKGALAAAIRETPLQPGVYYLTHVRESELKQVAVDTLRPLCGLFVRGIAA